jgi:hypothetical protein
MPIPMFLRRSLPVLLEDWFYKLQFLGKRFQESKSLEPALSEMEKSTPFTPEKSQALPALGSMDSDDTQSSSHNLHEVGKVLLEADNMMTFYIEDSSPCAQQDQNPPSRVTTPSSYRTAQSGASTHCSAVSTFKSPIANREWGQGHKDLG